VRHPVRVNVLAFLELAEPLRSDVTTSYQAVGTRSSRDISLGYRIERSHLDCRIEVNY